MTHHRFMALADSMSWVARRPSACSMFGQPPAATTGATIAIASASPPAIAASNRATRFSGAPAVQIASATAGAMKSPCALVRIAAATSAPAAAGQPAAAAASAAMCRQDVLRVEIAENAGVEQRRRIQPVCRRGQPRRRHAQARPHQREQQQRQPDLRRDTGQFDERVQRRRVRKMPMRPDPVGLAGHTELDQGQRRIVHRRGGARVLEHAALGRRAADAVHLADAMARGVVAPDFPDGEIAGAGAGQRRRADQETREHEREELGA